MRMNRTVSDQERRQLEDVLQPTPAVRWRTRCQAILMAHRGRRRRHLAEALRVNVRTLPRWLRVSQDTRRAGLQLRGGPGRRARMPTALTPESLGGIWPGPAGGGLERAHGTSAALATQRYRTHGLTVSASPRRAVGTTDGVRPSRPTSHELKADPAPQAMARQALQALQKRPRPEHGSGGGKRKRAVRWAPCGARPWASKGPGPSWATGMATTWGPSSARSPASLAR